MKVFINNINTTVRGMYPMYWDTSGLYCHTHFQIADL